MILINQTYSIVTPESAEHGDDTEHGFIEESAPYTFRELVRALGGGESSGWPARGEVSEWVSVPQGETRAFFELGEDETRSFHFARENPPRMRKYWRLAMRAAGVIRA